MKHIFSLACVLLTTFTYTMNKQYDCSFYRDSSSGKSTITIKDKANKVTYIATKNSNNTYNHNGLTSQDLQAFKKIFSQFEEAYKN